MLLASGLSTFPIKGDPVFNNGLKNYLQKLYEALKLVY